MSDSPEPGLRRRADQLRRQHPSARRSHLWQQPAAGVHRHYRPPDNPGRAARRPRHRRLPTVLVSGGGLGQRHPPAANPHHADLADGARGRPADTGDVLFHRVTPLVFIGSVAGDVRALDWIAVCRIRRGSCSTCTAPTPTSSVPRLISSELCPMRWHWTTGRCGPTSDPDQRTIRSFVTGDPAVSVGGFSSRAPRTQVLVGTTFEFVTDGLPIGARPRQGTLRQP